MSDTTDAESFNFAGGRSTPPPRQNSNFQFRVLLFKARIRKYRFRFKRFVTNIGKKNMKRSLNRHLGKLRRMINDTDDFWSGWIENKPEDKQHVSLTRSRVICTEMGCHLWTRMEICCWTDKDDPKELIKKLLKQLPIGKFQDEDGCNGIFVNDKEELKTAYCYVNPYFKNGYWQNHCLETRFSNII